MITAVSGTDARLVDRVPLGRHASDDEILERFLAWVGDRGVELYPAQEEAVLELVAGRHVVLTTPTGSGKSLVAVAAHFGAMCRGQRSVYTSPIKALVSEKFFELCRTFGAENVGMQTGDASINPDAGIVCCTAEILAAMCAREGRDTRVDLVVMDEFHYFADPERGLAWQLPLLVLERATFLLMTATLGDPSAFVRGIQARTGREVAHVAGLERPVPLEFVWSEEPLHEVIESLIGRDRAPVYVVNFSQREAAETAQDLVSANVGDRAIRQAVSDAIAGTRFDSPYGKDMQRFLRAGVGLHHAGLLPKYRLLVERLAQRGLLRVISGTDTLGVGINVPIRTVVFSKLCKFDGSKTAVLTVRDFKQIAGRAGRKGFDERGWVVAQAPEHVIENKRIDGRITANPALKKKLVRKKPPERGFVPWDEQTFRRLIDNPPETLQSSFRLDHHLLLSFLQRPPAKGEKGGHAHGYRALLDVIARSYERPVRRRALVREAAVLFRSLVGAGVVRTAARPVGHGHDVILGDAAASGLALHHALSLWALEATEALDPAAPEHALDVLSIVEAVLENPRPILERQAQRDKGALIERLKAEGVEYEDRMRLLEEVTWPKPLAELIYASFDTYRTRHPWVGDNVRPKGIAREMREQWASFGDYIKALGLQRSEGVLLRYLNDVYRALRRTLSERTRSEGVVELIEWLRATLERVDSSLLDEWESMAGVSRKDASALLADVAGQDEAERRERLRALSREHAIAGLMADPRALAARVRAHMQRVVGALAQGDWEEAALGLLWQEVDRACSATDLEAALAPFVAQHGLPRFDLRARMGEMTRYEVLAPGRLRVRQILCAPLPTELAAGQGRADYADPDDDAGITSPDDWVLEGELDLRADDGGTLLVLRIGP